MKRILALCLLLSAFAVPAMPAQVLRVIDGDTIEIDAGMWVMIGDKALRLRSPILVRVLGVDTPELHAVLMCERDMAQRARAFVKTWIGDGMVELDVAGLDKYGGRIDAVVWRGISHLATDLIAAGLGKPYSGGKRGAWCSE